MRINTNVSALNAANNLGRVQAEASESMAKLSSGFRINKAADDAAGLGIANKLRADTRALSQASRNAEQTNSLLQVAEGSTATIQKMLERMKELATQSGSDTVDAAGRGRINSEFTALRSEIDRTVSTTKFQGNALLDGTFGSTAPQLAASDITTTGGVASTALGGAYTVAVSSTGIATLNRPSGAVPPTYSIDLNAPTAGQVTYAAGKATLHFGTVGGNDEVKVAATAANATDVAGIQTALDQHGFTLAAAVATTSTAGTSSVSGAVVTLPASQVSGTLHFAAADSSVATAPATGFVTASSVGAQQAGGTYTIKIVSTNATIGTTANGSAGISGLAIGASQAAGGYTISMNSGNLEVKRGASVVATQAVTDANVVAGFTFSNAGISFAVAAGAGAGRTTAVQFGSDLAAANAGAGTSFTVNSEVRTMHIEDSTSAMVGAAKDLKTFDGSADISFSTGAGGISLTVDKTITFANMSANLNNKTVVVTGAHADLLDASNAVLATTSLTAYSAGTNVTISGGGYSVAFSGASTATNTYANLKSTLNNAASTITATQTVAASAAASAVIGNGQAGTNASFLVDSSGAYKTNDIIQLAAIDLRGSTLGLAPLDLGSAGAARNALSTIDTAISTVSTALGSIGANQNRISYATDNLKTKINNFSAAESVIRDVDMADEMTKFSKSNILAQAGTAMLAQANQAAQGVLQLLRG